MRNPEAVCLEAVILPSNRQLFDERMKQTKSTQLVGQDFIESPYDKYNHSMTSEFLSPK
jgi:hypothetical protein